MPYISKERRLELVSRDPEYKFISNAGEFNFIISSLINGFIAEHGKSYAVINELIGALECAKLELYRRIAAPYEDIKISENGDVYTV